MKETTTEATAEAMETETLYRHVKRAEWGLAILAWERPSTRGYQFQDGNLRVIKEGYYDLLAQVDDRPEGVEELVEELKQKAGLMRDKERGRSKDIGITFSDQMKIFRIEYPGGFTDEIWLGKIRGVAATRRLKRHRQPAIDDARAALADEALGKAIDGEGCSEVLETVIALLSKTNLVKPKELDVLRQLTPGQHIKYVTILRDLLYGETPLDLRLDRFSAIHGKNVTWPLATVPSALVQPDTTICIHPTLFRKQAQILEPMSVIGAKPNGRVYMRLLALSSRVRDLLTQGSLPPADLMDVFNFMGTTLRPSARKLLMD